MDEVNPLARQSRDAPNFAEKSAQPKIQEPENKVLELEAHRIGVEAVARALNQTA